MGWALSKSFDARRKKDGVANNLDESSFISSICKFHNLNRIFPFFVYFSFSQTLILTSLFYKTHFKINVSVGNNYKGDEHIDVEVKDGDPFQ